MISRNLFLNLLLRVLLIVILAVLLGYLIFIDKSFRFSLICFTVIVVLTINLISYLNSTNKKIGFFFDSVRNEDSNLSFSVEEKNMTLREIYKSMNRVNQQIKQLKIENRQQEQYFQILIEHLATGIITFNDKGYISHANSSSKKFLSVEVLTHLQQIERIDMKLYQAIKNIRAN
jgi:two-component system nitrogen regulation sensor histidine kinase NtrY